AELRVLLVGSAVRVGVDHDRRPALRVRLVAGLEELLRVEPTHHSAAGTAGARPEDVLVFGRKVQVVRREAGIGALPLPRLRVEYGEMPRRLLERRELRRGVRAVGAELGLRARRTDARGEPQTAFALHDRVVEAVETLP